MKSKAFPVFLMFLVMGFGDAIGPFVGLAKETFKLSQLEASLITFMGFIMFALLSIPMGILQDKKGKKIVAIIGLITGFLGVLIPVFGLSTYAVFLITVLLLGAANAILQVAGNPLMRDVSDTGMYSRNLSLGQFVKAIGSLSGPVLPIVFSRYFGLPWTTIFPVYSGFFLITIAILSFSKIEKSQVENTTRASFGSMIRLLLSNPFVATMVIAIFLYVGAEVCMSSGLPIFFNTQYQLDIAKLGLAGTGLFFLALMIGRFAGGIILSWISPKTFFILTNILSILGIIGLFIPDQTIGFASAFIIGLGFANIFPLVFSITVDAMPERTNELSGLMITAIVGGALVPLIFAKVSDIFSILMGFMVPLACIAYLFILSLSLVKKK
jgi:MFS transporter, FHS family, L-fucose permease